MNITNSRSVYKRILLKLSGRILQGTKNFGIDITVLNRVIQEIKELLTLNIQISIVVGGGNLFRGIELIKYNISRITSDHIGMLSTIINGLAIHDALHNAYIDSHVISSIPIHGICHNYTLTEIINFLAKNNIVIFVAGTGNALFTTDSAACLRGIEIKAEIILKATNVDGVFSNDPKKFKDTVFYHQLSYQLILNKKLKIMDTTAIILAQEHNLPICVFNINKPGALKRVIMQEKEGTLICS